MKPSQPKSAALATATASGPRIGGDLAEPSASRAVYTPMWLVAVFGVMLYWGALYLDQNAGAFHPLIFNRGEQLVDVEARVPRSEADALIAQGRRVYTTYCTACHQPSGRGLPGQFPTLAGSDWVNVAGPGRMIRIVLNGLQGPIIVNGTEFNNVMVPWREQLNDTDIAAVLTFVRSNKEWGNAASPVTPAQVKAIRDATQDRATSWTATELLAIPDKD